VSPFPTGEGLAKRVSRERAPIVALGRARDDGSRYRVLPRRGRVLKAEVGARRPSPAIVVPGSMPSVVTRHGELLHRVRRGWGCVGRVQSKLVPARVHRVGAWVEANARLIRRFVSKSARRVECSAPVTVRRG